MSDLFVDIKLPTGITYQQPIGLYIDGEWRKSDSTAESVNPATEEPITSVYFANEKDVDDAAHAAKKAFKQWKKIPGAEKAKLINKLADLTIENLELLSAVEALDTGKPLELNCKADIEGVADYLKYCAGWADKNHGKYIPVTSTKFAYTVPEPYGVVGQIVPWNYPLSMSGWKIAPALAAGNCIIIKSAENTPLSLLLFATLVEKAGFPKGVVNIISGYGPIAGSAIAKHPLISKVAFTGSTKVGSIVQKLAAENLKAVTLECGGKSPLIVFDDADIDQCIKWASFGIFYNSGQNCTSNSRIYVQEKIYDEFVSKFTKFTKEKYILKDPFDKSCELGPVISKIQYDRIKNYIEIGAKEGALMVTGNEPHTFKTGYYIQPTIFTDCTEDMTIVKEEIFGPVVAISKFSTQEEVIEKANNSTYGLASMVFTKDLVRGHVMAEELEAGMCYINSSNDEDIRVPFGGYKMSGVGRELGENGILAYTQVKAVHVNMGTTL
ncbi:hypothetical protein PACTADRAFT_50485 [Pachysolen tannophilus NRRL Y-2460]|uniref:Aldehyde dehydrogenase domain-containing protein n=1 Tax=Pachysolen tannophilus NRRL Y-2460 TaxID=669874 RepID=A0A1E4TS97_PACTA|nr:hypothetical protein PACTADRAFT_50485 [Pachysolen tannophilus NRRL Y-2460]